MNKTTQKEINMNKSTIHLPNNIMKQAREFAGHEQLSVDQFLVSLITEGLKQYKIALDMKRLAEQGNPNEAIRILNQVVPDGPPDPGDELRVNQ